MRHLLLVVALALASLTWAAAPTTDTSCFHTGTGCTDIEIPQTPSPVPPGGQFTGTVPTRCSIGRLWSSGTSLCVCTAKDVWKCVAVATTTTTTTTTTTVTTSTTTTVTTTTVTTTT